MQSVITSKFQTTIPKAVRERLKLSVYSFKKYNTNFIAVPFRFR